MVPEPGCLLQCRSRLGKKSKVKRKNRKKNRFSNRIKKVNPNPNPKGKENEDGNGDDLPGPHLCHHRRCFGCRAVRRRKSRRRRTVGERERNPSRGERSRLTGAHLALGSGKGHHHGAPRRRRARLRPHVSSGERRCGGAITSGLSLISAAASKRKEQGEGRERIEKGCRPALAPAVPYFTGDDGHHGCRRCRL
jgi:hypothetical protein